MRLFQGLGFFYQLLFIFLMAVQPVYTKTINEAQPYNVLREERAALEEGIVKINLPIELLRIELKKALEKSPENPNGFVKEIKRFDMDPMQNLLIISGTALMPADVVFDLNKIAGGGEFPVEHEFNISVKFPTASKLALTRYFSLEIVEFKIDGQNYLNAFNRVNQYLVGLLSNSSFMDWVLNVGPDKSQEANSLSEKIHDLITSKGLRFKSHSVSFKLDLEKIAAIKSYVELADFQLWNISPVLLKGTGQVALQIEAGLGKPGDAWFKAIKERGESEEETLAEARESLYEKYGNTSLLNGELNEFMDLVKEQLNFPLWEIRQENNYKSLKSDVESRVRSGLDLKNPLFKADPMQAYDLLKEEVSAFIVNELTELKRRAQTIALLKSSGASNNKLPFLTKRLSQESLSQGVRFARDFNFENEQMFPELEVIIAPHIPGVILRGVMNMDINVFMEMGLEGEGINWSASPWRAAEDIWGSGMPFEVSLRLHAFDKGVLGIDVVNFSLLSNSEKTSLSKSSGHGHLMATWTKMAIVEALTTMAFEDPSAISTKGDSPQGRDEPFKHTLSKINEQSQVYQREMGRILEGDISALAKLAEIDIEKNPFNQAGSIVAANNLRYLFQDIISYDDASEMIQFKLDPKIVTETILASENSVQVWNIESLYDSLLNQTYIEVGVGDGERSKKYVDQIFERREAKDSQDFVGIDETRESSSSDMIVKTDLKNFELFLNKLFTDASKEQIKGVNTSIRENVEQSHYVIKDLNLNAVEEGQIEMNLTASLYEKSKKGILGQLFSSSDWKVTQKDVLVKARLKISVEKLDKYKSRVKLSKNEVFFGDEVLKLDLAQAGIRFSGDTSTLDKMINLIASDINFEGGLTKKVKKVVLNFLHNYLNDQDPSKNGNTTLGGVKLNRYAKVLAHDEEILIQLNPHIMGVAFDVRLLNNTLFSDTPVGLLVNKSQNSIDMHFSTSGNLAAVDKGELLRVMVKAKELFQPFITGDKEIFNNHVLLIELFDRSIFNSDYTKLSLFHRLNRVMRNYEGVTNIIRPDTSVVDQINQNLGTRFGVSSGVFNNRQLTGSGVEIMYFLSAAAVLREQMEAFVARIEKLGLRNQVSFVGPMEGKIHEIETRFINPLMEVYKNNFMVRNSKILKKGITDWNYTYYPDALYCEGVYQLVTKWSEKSGR
ncbi:MAG: hypothetical protein K9K67_04015 [Bacteriovoracaceae bacterium]|nr:hypothetical protein [Bacteriovoracaceae bacterium]